LMNMSLVWTLSSSLADHLQDVIICFSDSKYPRGITSKSGWYNTIQPIQLLHIVLLPIWDDDGRNQRPVMAASMGSPFMRHAGPCSHG
jgi:hypothetical protein